MERTSLNRRFGPRPCENHSGGPHLGSRRRILRPPRFQFGGINLLATSESPRGFLQALIWSRRSWLHARIASSIPPTPTIIMTRLML